MNYEELLEELVDGALGAIDDFMEENDITEDLVQDYAVDHGIFDPVDPSGGREPEWSVDEENMKLVAFETQVRLDFNIALIAALAKVHGETVRRVRGMTP